MKLSKESKAIKHPGVCVVFVRVCCSLNKRSSKSGFITEITEKVIDASQLIIEMSTT